MELPLFQWIVAIVVLITNIDIDKNMETARKYSVRKVPTIVFEKDGIEVGRVSGVITKQAYEEFLNKLK